MNLARRWLFVITFVSFSFPLAVCYGQANPANKSKDVLLTPADQLILDAIDRDWGIEGLRGNLAMVAC